VSGSGSKSSRKKKHKQQKEKHNASLARDYHTAQSGLNLK
jgi:hypothetical protein